MLLPALAPVFAFETTHSPPHSFSITLFAVLACIPADNSYVKHPPYHNMMRLALVVQAGLGLWLSLNSALAFSTVQTQGSRTSIKHGLPSATARSIRRTSDLVVASEPLQGLLEDEETKVFPREEEDTSSSSSPLFGKQAGDLSQTIFTYKKSNGTDASSKVIETNSATSVAINENVGAILAASEDAMIAAEATLPEEVKKELGSFANDTVATTSTFAEDLVDIIPAEEVVGEAITKSDFDAPPVLTILKFAIPAVGVWLCSPLLSLIDTSAVGVLSGTVQQAALNPAVAVTDYAALLIVSTVPFPCS